MSKVEVSRIIKTLGSEAIEQAVGVGRSSVSNALWKGAFPALWFDQIETLCRERGIECPRHCFKWAPRRRDEDAA